MDKNLQIKLNDKGDYYSYNLCFDQMYAGMCVFAGKFITENDVAEDIVQDVFIKLWENFTSFNSILAIKTFLYISIKNKCLNYLDHLKVENKYLNEKLIDFSPEQFFIHEIIEIETHRAIHQAIGELPGKCREILLLSLDGLKNHEIAGQLNISVNTVKTQKSIAYNQLRKKLHSLYSFLLYLKFG